MFYHLVAQIELNENRPGRNVDSGKHAQSFFLVVNCLKSLSPFVGGRYSANSIR